MFICKSLQALANSVEMSNLLRDQVKSHIYAPFMGLRETRNSDGLLRSEDLKEEKEGNRPLNSILLFD